MKYLKQLERINKAHKLISSAATGSPREFAIQLGISQRTLYILLAYLKDFDAPIMYDKLANTYYYASDFDFFLEISIKVIKDDTLKYTYGGSVFSQKSYTARLLQ